MVKPTTFVIAFLVIAIGLTVFGQMATEATNDNYNETIDPLYSDFFSNYNASSSSTSGQVQFANELQADVGNSSAPDTLAGISITGAMWSALLSVFDSFSNLGNFISDASVAVGIPGWLFGIFLAILILVLVSIIAGRIFGRDI